MKSTLTLFSFQMALALLARPALAKTECLIIANGTPLPLKVVQAVLERMGPTRKVVALDGAVKTLKEFYQGKLRPDVILGDFDSSTPEDRGGFEGALVLEKGSQDFTDLEKGIHYCTGQGDGEIWIVNALSLSRWDHVLANLSFLKKYHQKLRKIRLVSDNEIIEFVKNDELTFSGRIGLPVGVFGLPKAEVTSQGLQFRMEKYSVVAGEALSSSNYIVEPEVKLRIEGDAWVTYPHLFQ